MAKTNKEIRWDLANKYYNKFRTVDETLDFLTNSWYSKKEVDRIREGLISNLQSKLSMEDGYEESKELHRVENEAKLSLKKAKNEKQRLKREYEKKMAEADRDINGKVEAYKSAQINYRWKMSEETQEEVKRNILDNLKQSIKVEDVHINWWKLGWKRVHITLPEVKWKFAWFTFDYVVSYESINLEDALNRPELEKRLYSKEDVCGLFEAVRKYMYAMGVEIDKDRDYAKIFSVPWPLKCDAYKCLKYILGLDSLYLIKDENLGVLWNCERQDCYCSFQDDGYYDRGLSAKLFLGLSDLDVSWASLS